MQKPPDGAKTSYRNIHRRQYENHEKVDTYDVVDDNATEQHQRWEIMTSTTTSSYKHYALVSVDAEGGHRRRLTTVTGVNDISVAGNAKG